MILLRVKDSGTVMDIVTVILSKKHYRRLKVEQAAVVIERCIDYLLPSRFEVKEA